MFQHKDPWRSSWATLLGVGMGNSQCSSLRAALNPRQKEQSLLHDLKLPKTDQSSKARNGKARDGEKQPLK